MDTLDQIRLIIPPDVAGLMEDRAILVADVQRVIFHAESTGEKFVNPATGLSLAYLRPGRVTFWVEYSGSDEEGYHVHSAYSHRMEMKRGGGA